MSGKKKELPDWLRTASMREKVCGAWHWTKIFFSPNNMDWNNAVKLTLVCKDSSKCPPGTIGGIQGLWGCPFREMRYFSWRWCCAGLVSRDVRCPDRKSTSVASARVVTLVKSARLYAHVFWKLFIQNYLIFISVFDFDISI